MSKNDDRILELTKKIQEKEEELKLKKKSFSPETTCKLSLDGVQYNLHVCDEDTLSLLLIKLNTYKMSASELKIKIPNLCGFGIDSWIHDITLKLEALKVKQEEKLLKDMKNKLETLLSEDKKTELEIDAIAAALLD